MRFKRLLRRSRLVSGIGAVFLAGMYAGRLSIHHAWLEWACLALWMLCSLCFLLPLFREQKREDRQFRSAMRHLEDEMRGKL